MTEPTDAELDALWDENDLGPEAEVHRRFARAVLAKFGTPTAVAGEPDAYLHDDGYWTPAKTDAGRNLNDRLLFAGSPKVAVYTTPQPTQAQADTPCRKNPFYHGPRNCIRGTVGCCEDHGAKTQAQAGAPEDDGFNPTPGAIYQSHGHGTVTFKTMDFERGEPIYHFDTARGIRYMKREQMLRDIHRTGKAQAGAVQLTRERVKAILTECGYDGASAQHRADFINGLRHGEAAHGIKGGQHGSNT